MVSKMWLMRSGLAGVMVVSALLAGCGSPQGADVPLYLPDDAGSGDERDSGEEHDAGGDSEEDVATDVSGDVDASGDDPDGGGTAPIELFYEDYHRVALTLPVGTTLRTLFQLEELSTPVELLVVRELRGYNEVQNTENERVVMTVNDASFVGPEAGWDREELPRGSYDAFLENLGGASGTDVNNYLAVKIASTPRMLASVADHEGTIGDYAGFLGPGQASGETFEAREGYTYVLRGVRGKNTVFVINTDQLPKIENSEPFAYLYTWDESSPELEPEPTVLDLEPGEYMVLVANNAGDDRHHGSVMVIDEWLLK
ncbi:hypothetical protein FRC98_08625 [Lujinxingia vulgaris]|uniref:DUF4382 domain-containing protein n=1 Tax=Lujinxingia vulgaris TaxID=2600176 RepID=A0A5C6XD97_9DELT|nr:hypothetical protein [Lujinxingia vulgaris]TXD37741.1 hypothetical protein FRC98_08625 [Lujinxingia vulgaris]